MPGLSSLAVAGGAPSDSWGVLQAAQRLGDLFSYAPRPQLQPNGTSPLLDEVASSELAPAGLTNASSSSALSAGSSDVNTTQLAVAQFAHPESYRLQFADMSAP